jgi:hypothetical protein
MMDLLLLFLLELARCAFFFGSNRRSRAPRTDSEQRTDSA